MPVLPPTQSNSDPISDANLDTAQEVSVRSDLPGDATPRPANSAHATTRRGSGLVALLRLLLLVPSFARDRLPTSGVLLLLLSVLIACGWVALDAYLRRPVAAFMPSGFVDLAWFAMGALSIAGVASILARGRLEYAQALLLVLLCVPAWVLLYCLLPPWVAFNAAAAGATLTQLSINQQLVLGLCVWSALVLLRGLRSHLALRAWPVWITVLLAGTLFSHASTAIDAYPAFWTNADEPADTDAAHAARTADFEVADWRRANALLFSQPARIDRALAQLPPAGNGASHVFFLGFAGFGDQQVFANEIETAQEAVSARFDVGPRALQLVNDRRDRNRQPLASVAALRHALAGLATHMNLDRDVLVLALSSHGSDDASIAVTNGGLPFEDLHANELAAALTASGIKWRVIVISACYGGGFIPALKDANTIVLTAAAADRTSFGCADDRELTYFGEAFYRDALPAAASLRDAFNSARAAIHKRELQEQLTPSLPAAWYGAAIEAPVAALFRPVQ